MKSIFTKIISVILVVLAVTLLVQTEGYEYCQAKTESTSIKGANTTNNKTKIKDSNKTKKVNTNKKSKAKSKKKAKVAEANTITIKCVGDSVTEGMSLPDAHQAVLDGSTYPSILYTMLNKNGKAAKVENAGHGGEDTASIVARVGGIPLYVNQDLLFNGNGKIESIDKKITAIFSETLQMPITLSYTETDVNPVVINGNKYKAVKEENANSWNTALYRENTNPTAIIPAGSAVQFGGTTGNTVTVIFAGINDSADINIDKYVEMLRAGANACGNNCIILGPHSKIYDKAKFVSGNTSEERRINYRNRMMAEFGERFVDLNNDWCERALTVATQNGFFSDYSADQLASIQNKLNARNVPAEFTINNKAGGVHLNKAGYTVIAQIVYERLLKLGYIK